MNKYFSKMFISSIFIMAVTIFLGLGSDTAKADMLMNKSKSMSMLSTTLNSERVLIVPESLVERTMMSRGKTLGASIVEYAYNFLGRPYVWGASGPNSFDCSGLTAYVYGKFGYNLGHYTGYQYEMGTSVSKDNLQMGDLVFFNTSGPHSHVGIYIGNGSFIHAPSTGDVVKISSLNDSYYGAKFCGGRRIIY
ncbi:C40 family peptidase [Clostridium grantii]|uniref:Cell wall-associated hydrolase, NlpC family n=1 Tax=Clostridium grantii DSM 8605 TaxID=1121316 RepID=A0A1M5X421_9CLOT|nr:C40 family peptidase [Clostridium grantii]SHH94264.1 Cell wall-associated hydrolase, NlpC family [Clostridium grantii DSM 8605]